MYIENHEKEYEISQLDNKKRTNRPSLNKSGLLHDKILSYGDDTVSNKIIHGENLDVLKLLQEEFSNAFKCVYLDPPYNNGESYLHYLDNMEHEKWLSNLSERLRIIKSLLSEDGSLWLSIDDSEMHYLKVMADSVFGRENFVSTIIWEKRTTRENRKAFSRNHEYVLVYAKNALKWSKIRNTLPLTAEASDRYKNPDHDPRGPWQSVSANVQAGHATLNQFYTIVSPSGVSHNPPKGRCWVYSESKMMEEIKKIIFGLEGMEREFQE